MKKIKTLQYIENVLDNIPSSWLDLTTHRLDIYNEEKAKTEFIEGFKKLFVENTYETKALNALPTAFDYIRLGHPLSCVLEWEIAQLNHLYSDQVISFSSMTMPVFAILRKNLLDNKRTQIVYSGKLPFAFDPQTIKEVYGYHFEIKQINNVDEISAFDGSTIYISDQQNLNPFSRNPTIDFYINLQESLGSVVCVLDEKNNNYISEIQHVRRRESIAMTPANCLKLLNNLTGKSIIPEDRTEVEINKNHVISSIKKITAAESKAIVASSGLSIQYAIMMGLIDDALKNHPGKDIKFIVPPNCYGGTNDQARRVAACVNNVEVMDLPVDGHHNMVQSINTILEKVAKQNAVPYIIAEIPTNPRVEVPDLNELSTALSKTRYTTSGKTAIAPVFILDQTFCPNVQFLSATGVLSSIKTISYVSGSKFPSGGKCTAGYCVANKQAKHYIETIEKHLKICDNEATALQLEVLAKQMPSMNQRIADAYKNTLEFVNFVKKTLPSAKINFVSKELAEQGFTPSVFSLDLPTKGKTEQEKETYKRKLNQKLIDMMITEIPQESKYCVSYGQLKGCYWTIPATSTQGTTKEGDKDYIVRVSLSPNLDLERHKKVFADFVAQI